MIALPPHARAVYWRWRQRWRRLPWRRISYGLALLLVLSWIIFLHLVWYLIFG